MKHNSLPKIIGASVLAASLAVLPSTLSASAQSAQTDTNANTTETQQTAGDRDFDWGWLGLLGLLGLAGLARKHEEPAVRYREPDEAGTRTRY